LCLKIEDSRSQKNKKTNEDLLASFLGEKKEAFPLLQETKKKLIVAFEGAKAVSRSREPVGQTVCSSHEEVWFGQSFFCQHVRGSLTLTRHLSPRRSADAPYLQS
jgi:hypothetical protein